MVTAREKIQDPIYQELSGLVLALKTKELRERWFENEKRRITNTFRHSVRASSLDRYTHELTALLSKLNACRDEFDRTIAHWDKTPTSWANFPDKYRKYRDMITLLAEQKAKVDHEINLMIAEKRAARRVEIEAARARTRTTSARRTTTPPAPPRKKSGFWKGAALAAGLVGGAWFLNNKVSSSNDEPSETDKITRSRTVHMVKVERQQPKVYFISGATAPVSNGGRVSTSSGSSLRHRLQDAVDLGFSQNTIPASQGSFESAVAAAKQRNYIAALDAEGSDYVTHQALNLGTISDVKRQINRNEWGMVEDGFDAVRNISYDVSDSAGSVRRTIEETRGVIENARNLFKVR